MQFLLGAEKIHVETIKDGIKTTLDTSGAELLNSLAEGEGVELKSEPVRRQDGSAPHGTAVTVKMPNSFHDPATGEDVPVSFDVYHLERDAVLRWSPLFEDVVVAVNGNPLHIGANFDKDRFTTFAVVKFDWGDARVIVSKGGKEGYGQNVHVLSNGLWQFSDKLNKKPDDPWSGTIDKTIYINLEPRV